MFKVSHFGKFRGPNWPTPEQLEPYFFGGEREPWVFEGRNDSWGLGISGLNGTAVAANKLDRVNVDLYVSGRPKVGVTFTYHKWGKPLGKPIYFLSKGDLSRRLEFVESTHGDALSLGLFVPFKTAWHAVKEFIETDGELPKCIEWLSGDDLPQDTFPVPHDPKIKWVTPI